MHEYNNELIEQSLKELLLIKSREERKFNGRLIAILVAFLVIFLAIYHAFLRKKTTVLAGVLVPVLIMTSYGGWVLLLAKRDKQRQVLFEKHLREISKKNRARQRRKRNAKKSKRLSRKSSLHKRENLSKTVKLRFENEVPKKIRAQKSPTNQQITKNNENISTTR